MNGKGESILIVEDEAHLALGLRFNLEAEGYITEIAESGELALERLLRDGQHFHAVVLDVMLPGKTGFDVTQQLRDAGNFTPILILTALGRSEDVLRGFEAGADDYLAKPFELAILIARVRALIRRRQWHAPASTEPLDTYSFDNCTIDFTRLEMQSNQQTFGLTVMEADLLRILIQNEGKPVSRGMLLEKVWGLKEDTDTRAIDNFIVRLRKYLEADPSRPKHLLTVRRVGYEFKR
jgi:two-component system, OmpR family, alkaline phosphatase synthesis response regulator PhoP